MKEMINNKKYNDILDTALLTDDLKKNSVRGVLYTLSGEGITFFLRICSISVLARILIPEHFGLIGMVAALIAIADRFKDLGLSIATIQKDNITHSQVSTLFWLNFIVGILIASILCILSKLIGWFYDDNRLIWITIAISTTFLFGGISIQHQAILRRRMQYGRLAIVKIGSTSLSLILAIFMAIKGYEYWALVYKEIAQSIFLAIGSWIFCPWKPGLPKRDARIGEMVRFGRDITAFSIITYFAQNLDLILVGKFYGPSLLGIYRQAYQLMLIPIAQLTKPVNYVAESSLSILQNNALRYRRYYKKIVTTLNFISMPLVVFLFINSREIVLLLLGEKWIGAIKIFKILAIAAFIKPAAGTTGFVMITCGKTKRYLFVGVLGTAIYIIGILIGIRWGTTGIAVAHVFSSYICFFTLGFIAFRGTPISMNLMFNSIAPAAISSIAMGIVLYIFLNNILIVQHLYTIAISSILGVVVYLSVWFLIPGGFLKLKEIILDFSNSFKITEA